MQLTVQIRRVGEIVVVTCAGRLVVGPEVDLLQSSFAELMPLERDFILDLGAVTFIDSSGIGTLVRLLSRVKAAHGGLKLCALPKQMTEVLALTHLDKVFEYSANVESAVADFYRTTGTRAATNRGKTTILCAHRSADVLAYVREVLGGAGYHVTTAVSLLDARALLAATRPSAVVISSHFQTMAGSHDAERFRTLVSAYPVVELQDEFVSSDPAAAAQLLLQSVQNALESREAKAGGVN